MFGDQIISLIRTYVPVAVGSVASWLLAKYGIGLDEDASKAATVAFTALLIALYYTLVRVLESKWPVFGKLLGAARQPTYVDPTDPTDQGSPSAAPTAFRSYTRPRTP